MVTQLSQIGFLLLIAALIAVLTRRLHMPYTVGLVLGGMGLSFMPLRLDLTLTKDLIYSLFLPPLVFEAALYIHWRELRQDLPVVGLLATLGVLLAAALTAAGMHYLVNWGWAAAGVFGVLIAATDPVSVIATFREAGVRGRLRLLLEAESLLNDGTAAVLFVAALGLAAGATGDLLQVTASLLLSIGGGALCGAALGFVFMFLAGRSADRLVEISFTTLSAYGSFFLAEHFHLSGVLAALTAGLVTGNYSAPGFTAAPGRDAVRSFWEYVAFLANSFVFLLIGAHEAQQHFGTIGLAVLAAIALVTLGRALAIYPVCALFNRGPLRVAAPHQHVLFWGGLRGALALALALGLPADFPQRDAIVTVTFGVVAFSIFAQGLTMTPLLRRLGQL
ncbi:MAG TPA: sodium:proton antiporter [Steroidobacteraceae bacterium]